MHAKVNKIVPPTRKNGGMGYPGCNIKGKIARGPSRTT